MSIRELVVILGILAPFVLSFLLARHFRKKREQRAAAKKRRVSN